MIDELKPMIKEAALSTAVYSLLFHKEHFSLGFSQAHKPMFELLDDPKLSHRLIAAPRGFGKTTIVDLGFLGRNTLFGFSPFTIIISNTFDHAVEQLTTFKNEIISNEMIEAVFGPMKGDIWQADRIKLANGSYIIARGAGQQIRGLKHGKWRPTLVVFDDLESAEGVASEERRAKLKKWFYSDLLRAGHQSGRGCQYVGVGTLLHQASLLADLMEDPTFKHIRLEAFDDNLEPYWPEWMSKEEILELYEQYEAIGQLDTLVQEYRNIVISPETQKFRKEYMLHYEPGDTMFRMVEELCRKNLSPSFVLGDPAKTNSLTSDYYSAIGGVIDPQSGSIYFHKVFNERCDPLTWINACFDMADQLNTRALFLKTTSLHDWMMNSVRSAMLGRGKVYDIIEVREKGKKEHRIAELVPLYKARMVHHNKSECKALESQLLNFPRSRYDDLADCAADVLIAIGMSGGWDYSKLSDIKFENWEVVGSANEENITNLNSNWNVI